MRRSGAVDGRRQRPRFLALRGVRETLFVDGVRLARPVPVDLIWAFTWFPAGEQTPFVAGDSRPDTTRVVSAAVRLHEATGKLAWPRSSVDPGAHRTLGRRRRLHRR